MNVKIIHQCFAYSETPGEDQAIYGIWGPRSSSPFKKVSARSAVAPLNVPGMATRGQMPKIPSMEQFLAVNSAGEFSALAGEDGCEDVTKLGKQPCSFWIHPFLFRQINGVAGGRAANIGLKVIESLRLLEADEDDSSSAAEGYQTLVFLWAVERGYATNVPLYDPPTDEGLQQVF